MYNKIENSELIHGNLNQTTPYISIVIPTYKRPDLLKEAIDSALNQKDFQNYEIIVVDDDPTFGTNTETEQLIKTYNSPKLFYYKNKINLKMIKNWNQCFLLARGEYVTMLHDDDLLHENFLKEISKKINGSKLCISRVNYFYNSNELKEKIEGKNNFFITMLKKIKNFLFKKSFHTITIDEIFYSTLQFSTLTALYNKKSFFELGGFSEETFPSSDHFFNYEYVKKFGGTYLNYQLATYRYFNNASFTVAKYFPKQLYDLKLQIIKNFPENKFREIEAQVLYYLYLKNVSHSFNLTLENLLPEDLCSSKIFKKEIIKVKQKKKKLFLKNLF